MSITDFDYQLLLIQQVGDVDFITADPVSPLTAGSTGIILQNADRIWNVNSAKLSIPVLGHDLFGYYFKRDAVSLVIAILESRVDFSAVGTAMSVRLSQRVAARQMQTERYVNEIIRLEKRLSSLAVPQGFSLITQIEPIMPPLPGQVSSPAASVGKANVFTPDADDPVYQGSPYYSRGPRVR